MQLINTTINDYFPSGGKKLMITKGKKIPSLSTPNPGFSTRDPYWDFLMWSKNEGIKKKIIWETYLLLKNETDFHIFGGV